MKRSVGVGLASLVLGSSLVVGSPVSAEPVYPNSDTVCDPTQPFTLSRTFSPGAEYTGVPPVGSSIVVNSVADLPAVLAGLSGTFNGDNGGTPVTVDRSLAAYDDVAELNWGGQQSPYPGSINQPTFDEGIDPGVPAAIAMQDIIDGVPYHKANFTLSDCTVDDAVWPQWSGNLGPFVQENVAPGPLGEPSTTTDRFNSIEMIVRCPAGTTDVDYSWNVTMRGFPSEVRDPGQSGTVAMGSIPTMVANWPGMPLYIDNSTLPAPTLRLVVRPGDAGLINANITCRQGATVLAEFDHVSTEANMVWAYQEQANSHSTGFVPVDGSLPLEIGEEFFIDIECDRDAHGIDVSFNPGTTGLTAFSGTYIWTQGVYNRTPYGPIDREPGMTPVWRNGYDSEVDGEIIDLQEPFTWRYGPFVPTSLGTVSYTYACDDHMQGFSGATPVTRTTPVTEDQPDPVYDLALVKVVNDADGVVAPGDSVEWTIRVTNQGNVPSGMFDVTDTLPTGLEFASASDGGYLDAGVVYWEALPSLAVGASMDLTLTTTVPADAVNGTSFRNWSEISLDSGDDEDSTPDTTTGSDQTPSDPYTDIDDLDDSVLDNFDATDEDDNDDAEITVQADAPAVYDLALVKVVNDADGIIAAGDNVTWTIRVTNQGDVASGLFSVTDTMPTGTGFVSADNGGTEAAGVITWADLPSLAVGGSVDLTVTLSTDAAAADGTVLRNWAEISADSGDDEDSTPDTTTGSDQTQSDPYTDIDDLDDSVLDNFDGTDEDDNDDAEVTLTADPPVDVYDLALVKVVNDADGVVAPDSDVSWTIRVTNQGDVASGVFDVTDVLPAGLSFVSADNGGTEAAGVVTWAGLASLAPGASVDLIVTTQVPAAAADGVSFRNWAEISADSGDDEDSQPNTDVADDEYSDIDDLDDSVLDNFDGTDEDDNDDAEITVSVDAPAVYDLALVKVVNDADGIATVGDQVTWTIRVTNQGDVASGLFSVTDVLPASAAFVSADNGGTEAAGVVTWAGLASLAPGASVDLTVTTTLVAAGSARNWAEISSDSGDDEDSTPDTDVSDDEYTDIDDLNDSTDDNFDGTDEDDNDDAEIDVVDVVGPDPEYDLALAKIVNDADGVVQVGSNVQWTIRVTNQGDVDSGLFSVTDTLPAGVSFVSASNGGTVANGVVTWANLPSIPAGATFDVTVVTTVNVAGEHRNWAEISTDSGDDIDSTPDTDSGNDPYVGTDDLDRPDFGEDDHDDATIVSTTTPGPVTGGSTDGLILFGGFVLGAGLLMRRTGRRMV